jgi:carbamoyltransferase
MKDIVNIKIKFREAFRPFAPSVPAESASKYFELPTSDGPSAADFMLLVTPVRPAMRAVLPAITHADGTGRLQTVDAASNPRYHRLIERFGALTGVPVLLNTSFNLRGEPVVNTPREAWNTFCNSGIDVLVLGDFVVFKENIQASDGTQSTLETKP